MAPSACSSNVLLPMPGSPPMRVTEPATRPPSSTRSSSASVVARRGAPRCRRRPAARAGCSIPPRRRLPSTARRRSPTPRSRGSGRATWGTRSRKPHSGSEHVFGSWPNSSATRDSSWRPARQLRDIPRARPAAGRTSRRCTAIEVSLGRDVGPADGAADVPRRGSHEPGVTASAGVASDRVRPRRHAHRLVDRHSHRRRSGR